MHADEARKREEARNDGGWHACNTKPETNRLIFFFASTLIAIIACMIVGFGATQYKDNLLYEFYDGARENLAAAIVVGAMLIVVGLIGCFGAVFNHRNGVLCFFIFCFTVLVGQLFVITFFYARMHPDSVRLEQTQFKTKWISFAAEARGGSEDRNKAARKFLSNIQTEYACCGYDDVNDPVGCEGTGVPSSGPGEPAKPACLQLPATCDEKNKANPCKDKLADFVHDAMEPWAVGYIIFLVFEFLLLFSMCLVLCHIKPEAKDTAQYIGDYYQTKNPA